MARKTKSRFTTPGDQYLFEENRKKILHSDERCALCGGYVDKTLKYPHPMSATVDHKIPISKGGTSQLDNLQLAHWICNRLKSNKTTMIPIKEQQKAVGTRDLPHLMDWTQYRATNF